MNKLLITALAVVLGFSAVANAQQPRVRIYFDEGLRFTSWYCPAAPIGTVAQNLYVVAEDFGIWMNAIEYRISYPPQLFWAGDNMIGDAISIGSSPAGIGIAFPTPLKAFTKAVVQTATVIWMCDNCGPPNLDAPVQVWGHPSTGLLRAVEWPNLNIVIGKNSTSFICYVHPVQETTWGRVKALYR